MTNTNEKKVMEVLEEKATTKNVEAKETKKREVAKGNVSVCCAFPMGLKLALKNRTIKLNGVPLSHIVSATKSGTYLPAGKYGTTIVSVDEWEEIVSKYGKCDFMVNEVVFAKKDYEDATELAKEKSEKELGFEQVDPKKTKRTKKVETVEE